MEGAYREFMGLGLHLETFEHLLRCLFGERKGEDLIGPNPMINEMKDFFGDDSGLSGAWACKNQLVPMVLHRPFLRGIEDHSRVC